jgi:hypothetical protein
MLPGNQGERIFSSSYGHRFLRLKPQGFESCGTSKKVAIASPFVFGKPPHLEMTIICGVPSLPVEVLWHLLTPSQRYICVYTTTPNGPPQLAAAIETRLSAPSEILRKQANAFRQRPVTIDFCLISQSSPSLIVCFHQSKQIRCAHTIGSSNAFCLRLGLMRGGFGAPVALPPL